ncbi:flagellar motor switch protein FliN [Candidatus Berkiella cookevillensis]|uniref:Flagellar motor switch protein FliN n=1 Tax=Candidatus Berkiella cookevillensis TaxID=437022 RepID=A0A0Q9YUT5_9GAMM|nr:flagellar motor switch protein FliN [Candidatus Berkiella cookevillensis]MCS5708602.1 flagellar motor switch protein FliN [Candidatus Berkiella cookevillensis]
MTDENIDALDAATDSSSQKMPSGARFEDLTNENKDSKNDNPDLDVIMDIPVSLSLEVGKTSISIRKLLNLNQGSVIELDRLAGEPLDVLVNGTLIAHAEVVVVNDKFGLRLMDVINAEERIRKL